MNPPPVVNVPPVKRPVSPFVIGLAILAGAIMLALLLPALGGPKRVQRIGHADPKLQTAAKKAQAELDIFLGRLREPAAGERFAVRAGFDTPSGKEYLWAKDPVFEPSSSPSSDGTFVAILDQEPLAARTMKKGQLVRIPRENIVDWLIAGPNGREGAYTEAALSSP